METIRVLEYNVSTGETIDREIELTEEELIARNRDALSIEIRNRMNAILVQLSESDWKTIKYIEGNLSIEEFNQHISLKTELRNEYNILEEQFNNLWSR